jgi:hypothetical protein
MLPDPRALSHGGNPHSNPGSGTRFLPANKLLLRKQRGPLGAGLDLGQAVKIKMQPTRLRFAPAGGGCRGPGPLPVEAADVGARGWRTRDGVPACVVALTRCDGFGVEMSRSRRRRPRPLVLAALGADAALVHGSAGPRVGGRAYLWRDAGPANAASQPSGMDGRGQLGEESPPSGVDRVGRRKL